MSTVMTASTDFYERLGLGSDVTDRDVKVAYAQAIRKYPPERHPEEFKRIREAFEALSTAQARGQYDTTSDPATMEWIERGQEALEDDDHNAAIAAFKRALVLKPDAHFVRNLLGVSYLYAEQHRNAHEQFLRLTEQFPDNHIYWLHRGASERGLDQRTQAEASYKRAIDLNQEESSGYIGLSGVLADQERTSEAESVLERAIRADGVIDFDDISYFFELINLKLREGDVDGIEEVATRIEGVLSESWQRERVAYRFATLAQFLVEFKAFKFALALAEKSQQLAPTDPQIMQLTRYIRSNSSLIEEWQTLQNDPGVRDGFKFLIAVLLQNRFDEWDTEDEKSRALESATQVLTAEAETLVAGGGTRRSLADELEYISSKYSHVAQTISTSLEQQIRNRSYTASQVWLTCPNCDNSARGSDKTGRYTCPQCNQSFDFDSATGKTTKWSGKVQAQRGAQQVGAWMAQLGALLFLVLLAQAC